MSKINYFLTDIMFFTHELYQDCTENILLSRSTEFIYVNVTELFMYMLIPIIQTGISLCMAINPSGFRTKDCGIRLFWCYAL